MKRIGGLWGQVTTEANFHLAFAKAVAGKRDRREVRRLSPRLDDNLRGMARDLAASVFPFGHYRRFTIHEPKERTIHAARFEERVVHHALINVCGPFLERRLTADVFACRTGMGRSAALARAATQASRLPWFLKMDVRKYFESIPHPDVMRLLERIFKDDALLECFERILASHHSQPGRGLPIGSLISQHLANAYLASVDRLVRAAGVGGYARYMDDMVAWAFDRSCLRDLREQVDGALGGLGLEFKPTPYLNRTAHGMDFLGARVFSGRLQPNRATRVRWERKMRRLDEALAENRVSAEGFQRRTTALCAHLATCGGEAFRSRVLREKVWSDATGLESGQSRRLVEQQRHQQPRGQPQQEPPVQQEQQPGLPPGPSTPPEAARAARPGAVPASVPSRERVSGQTQTGPPGTGSPGWISGANVPGGPPPTPGAAFARPENNSPSRGV